MYILYTFIYFFADVKYVRNCLKQMQVIKPQTSIRRFYYCVYVASHYFTTSLFYEKK